ncbi:S-crystallin SL11-like [Mercenaria mercenaria]|uniref:S-crystallin SL11-like n=1 Tax=Mercenaria mercenaria TaxID=6596 RepID=UPI00234EEF23|nr:S-crystallin SL11-like [Mercenaria mercenaria]
MSHEYEFVYFNAKLRGETTRLLFAAAGIQYKDTRIGFAEWHEKQKDTPQGSLPYLVIDGRTKVSQSMAINRYIARIADPPMCGSSSEEELYINEIADTAATLIDEALKPFTVPEEKRQEVMTNFNDVVAPKLLGFLEKSITARAGESKNGFAVGSKLSLADIMIFNAIECGNLTEEISKYPGLKASTKKVAENKRIAEWLSKRPTGM